MDERPAEFAPADSKHEVRGAARQHHVVMDQNQRRPEHREGPSADSIQVLAEKEHERREEEGHRELIREASPAHVVRTTVDCQEPIGSGRVHTRRRTHIETSSQKPNQGRRLDTAGDHQRAEGLAEGRPRPARKRSHEHMAPAWIIETDVSKGHPVIDGLASDQNLLRQQQMKGRVPPSGKHVVAEEPRALQPDHDQDHEEQHAGQRWLGKETSPPRLRAEHRKRAAEAHRAKPKRARQRRQASRPQR